MTKATHTPGPWIGNRRTLQGKTLAFHVCDGKRGSADPICEKEINYTFSPEELEANARLIAAAPELLELAKLALEWATYETEYDGRMYQICNSCDGHDGKHHPHCKLPEYRAAIAKATGQAA